MIRSTKKYIKAKKKYLDNFYFFCLFDDFGTSLEFRRHEIPVVKINENSNKFVKAIISTLSNLDFNESVLSCIRQVFLKDVVRNNFQVSFLVHDKNKCHFMKYLQNKLKKQIEEEEHIV